MTLDTSLLNKHDKVYHQLTYDILTKEKLNFRDADRVVIDTIGGFGDQIEYDLSDETIPLSNTKNIGYKTQLFPEIVGFLRNENNLKWYLEQGMKIWTPNAFNFYRKTLPDNHPWKKLGKDTLEFNDALSDYEKLVLSGDDPKAGDLGNFYPKQWNSFKGVDEKDANPKIVYINQLKNMITKLSKNPTNRYSLVTAWNPYDVEYNTAALAPCHVMFQAYRYTDNKGVERLDMKMYQRSADHHLGVAFNGPQYAAITSILAKVLGIKPGTFTHSFGDIHLYCGTGERSDWYRNKDNKLWLQKELKTKDPSEVLENLLDRLPSEGNFPGYDHVPAAIKQLTLASNAEPATLEVLATDLDNIEVKDLVVHNYKRAPKIEIDGVRPRMAS